MSFSGWPMCSLEGEGDSTTDGIRWWRPEGFPEVGLSVRLNLLWSEDMTGPVVGTDSAAVVVVVVVVGVVGAGAGGFVGSQ